MLFLPEMMAEAQERYEILRQIHDNGPVGRHLLAMQTKLSENTVRKHIERVRSSFFSSFGHESHHQGRITD